MSEALERVAGSIAARFGLASTHGAGRRLGAYLERRAQALGLPGPDAYAARALRSEPELWTLACAMSNGWTWFFRDEAQLTRLVERLAARPAPRSVWVAGCSTGEEAYGLAMLCMERGLEVQVTATDLDPERLAAARRGVYGGWSLRNVPSAMRARWLEQVSPASWRVSDALRSAVQLRRHNLMDAPPWTARYDAVACRNVLIYCTQAGVGQILRNLNSALAPGGELVLGASDALPAQLAPIPSPSSAPRPSSRQGIEGKPGALRPSPPPAPPPSARGDRACSSLDLHDALGALLTTGQLLVRAHAFDRAEEVYRRAAELEPCSAELHLSWGVLHRKRGDWERAVSALRQAIFLDPGLWYAWALLAGCLARLGRVAESERAREQARIARSARPETPSRSRLGALLPGDDELLLIESDARAL